MPRLAVPRSLRIASHGLRIASARRWRSILLLAAGALLASLCACTTDPLLHADALAHSAGMQRELITTKPFVLTAYARISKPGAPLHIYIEGDGQAWLSRSEPSLDPTPHRALGLTLAAADPAANVVYLARPCQFTPAAMNPSCGPSWWTSQRYAGPVIDALDQAIDQYLARTPTSSLALIGYSGGGALAILIAARRHDIASIRTVAGNLDDEFVNRLHQVSAMPQSENPYDYARQVAAIPQLHFSGADDGVVPPEVARRFVDAVGGHCARAVLVPGLGHESDWAAQWPGLLADTPQCTAALTGQ